MPFELPGAYQTRYDAAVQHYFPPYPVGMAGRYFDAGLSYFATFEGFGDQYDILAVEERFEITVQGNPFVGIADLVLRDRHTGALVVIDHKSKSAQTMRKQMTTYRRQLYLYASAVQSLYGQPPSLLRFNLFREGVMVDEPYSPAEHTAVLAWAGDTIVRIGQETAWPAQPQPYFCRHLCSCAAFCSAVSL